MVSLNFPTTVTGTIFYVIGLVALWVVISVPVYFAGKVFTKGRSDFGDAMGATLVGAVGFFIVLFGVNYFLGAVTGTSAGAFAFILAMFVWLAVYRAAFRTSWLRAIGIVVLAWLILAAISFALVRVFGLSFPDFFPFI